MSKIRKGSKSMTKLTMALTGHRPSLQAMTSNNHTTKELESN